jgi:DNA helicase-2/ATP-dependent DNA helicase PcrA
MTRAKRYLFLSHARRRFLFGQQHRLPPSPFLAAIAAELAERTRPEPPRARGRDTGQLDLFG